MMVNGVHVRTVKRNIPSPPFKGLGFPKRLSIYLSASLGRGARVLVYYNYWGCAVVGLPACQPVFLCLC
jgi:hypothetical protein